MGALLPVSISCSTASVCPVRVDPGAGNKSVCLVEYPRADVVGWCPDPAMSDSPSREG